MLALIEQDLQRYPKNVGLSFPRVVLVAMKSVELYSTQNVMTSSNKLQSALDLIPQILDIAVAQNIMTQNAADSLKTCMPMANSLIGAFIDLSKNPAVIQAELAIKENITKCFAKCKKKPVTI